MAITNAAQAAVKTVADPNASYESLKSVWQKNRAVCSGERYVKDFDVIVGLDNLLIPFSPTMTQEQYAFYKAEAELPGITAQFAKMIVGGLLRKQPILRLPEELSKDVYEWIMYNFGKDDGPLSSFLDQALWEEVQTSRAWVFVDYPTINNAEALTKEELMGYKPYPILYKAESIINWRTRTTSFGKTVLDRVIVRGYSETFEENEFHPTLVDTVWVHELNENGFYQIRKYQKDGVESFVPVIAGTTNIRVETQRLRFNLIETLTEIKKNGEPLREIPAWPLNGNIDPSEPILSPIIDKEISLYNKVSRRNHLLYGASTYTPIIMSDMADDDFEEIVNSGLGTWIRLRQGDDAKVLETPTAALQDMDRSIAAAIEEMAKLGIRMLSPESAQSGIALEIRNAAQTAQLGTLNNKVSMIMKQVISLMINWRLGTDLRSSDIEFSLSADFNPTPLGSDWLRLATEWYQQGLVPRSIWLEMLKHNDLIPPDYDDQSGQQEITADNMINVDNQSNFSYAEQISEKQSELQD